MREHLQAVVTVLSLVNPAVCAAMFAARERGRTRQQHFKDATQVSVAVLVILLLSALVGVQFLHQFGISLDAFKVAGGVVLSWMGFSMLSAKEDDATASPEKAPEKAGPSGDNSAPSLTPLILFAASPGTITGVITIAADHTQLKIPWTAIVAVCVAVVITWPLMVLAASASGKGGKSALRETISRFMGLIVLAMGVQFVLAGLKAFFQATS